MENTWNEAERGPQVGAAKKGWTIWKYILKDVCGGAIKVLTLPAGAWEVLRMGEFEGETCVWVAVNLDSKNDYQEVTFRKHPMPFLENFSMKLNSHERPFAVDHKEGFTYLYTFEAGSDLETELEEFNFFCTKTGAPVPEEVYEGDWVFVGHYGPFIQQELALYVWWNPNALPKESEEESSTKPKIGDLATVKNGSTTAQGLVYHINKETGVVTLNISTGNSPLLITGELVND